MFRYRHVSLGAFTILLVALALVAFTGEKSAQAQVPDCDGAPACIIIFKETDPSGVNTSFEFYVDHPTLVGADFEIEDGESFEIGVFVPGSYFITEEVPPGWDLVDLLCDSEGAGFARHSRLDEDAVEVIASDGFANVGFEVVCTFQNVRSGEGEDEADERDQFIGGGLFAGDVGAAERNRARARAAAAVAVAATPRPAETIRPPSTGDGGLLP